MIFATAKEYALNLKRENHQRKRRRKARSNTMGLQPHYIAKKEMIEINEQTTTKVEYPKGVNHEDLFSRQNYRKFNF